MGKVISGVLITVLVIALVGTGYWGYQENQEKNLILIKAENQYQRAFHDLNFHIDALQDELGKTLVVNSRKQLSPSLANVWRLAYSAQSDVGQLPLTLMPFNRTEEFLSKIADFSYRIAIRDLSKEPLTNKEYDTLKTLYNNSKKIQNELHNIQTEVINKQLRWMDVEIALAEESETLDNTIIDGFKTVDKKVQEFPELDFGPVMAGLENKKKHKENNLKGTSTTPEKAKQKVISFLGLPASTSIDVEKSGKGYDYQAYSVKVNEKNNDIYLDVTKKGGHIVWMMTNREIKSKKLSVTEGINKANQFLKNHNYLSMVPITVDEYDNTLIINYAYKENNVIVYPDIVSVKVAMDNGEIINFQSVDYVFNHKSRIIPTPKINKETAKAKVNPNLDIKSIKLALVENYNGEEVLTYELTSEFDQNIYRIYINATNGDEEMVEKIEENNFYQ